MCRLAAYLGEPIALETLLLKPAHSLFEQSWMPRELSYAKLNADGFGFGWYAREGEPLAYRQTMPIWADSNLPALASVLRAPLWLAMVRSATADYGVNSDNSQPFVFGGRMFMHNGFVKRFNERMRRDLLAQLDEETLASLRGHTDSEHLCALIHHFAAQSDPLNALRETATWCAQYDTAMLNFIVSDGDAIYVMRHAVDEKPPTLYYVAPKTAQNANALAGGITVASECFDDDADWQTFPEHHIAVVRAGDVTLHSL